MGCAGTGRSSPNVTPIAARTLLWARKRWVSLGDSAQRKTVARDTSWVAVGAEALRTGGERIMECSRLRVDARNTPRLRVPEEPLAFLVLVQS